MPLSQPHEREPIHLRDIALCGYQRADGLFDIEAHLRDTRTAVITASTAAGSNPASHCTTCGCA